MSHRLRSQADVTPFDVDLDVMPKAKRLLIVLSSDQLSSLLDTEMTSQRIIVVTTNQFGADDFGYVWEALVVHYFVEVFPALFQPFGPNSPDLLVLCLQLW